MSVAIVKYNAGNVRSVTAALQRLGVEPIYTDCATELRKADKVIFPGVGEARSAMEDLKGSGLDQVLPTLSQPVLGICLGLALLCQSSEEGNTPCLGIFSEKVLRFPPLAKVPHVGWNSLHNQRSALFSQIDEGSYFYFVHSYFAEPGPNCIASCDYITNFSAALHKDNFFAAQFHPEKSGAVGEKLLKNFLEL